MQRIFFFALLLTLVLGIFAQDGILNGKDDSDYAQELARWGYYDLAENIANRLAMATWLPEENRQSGRLLRCSLLQIRGEKALTTEEQNKWYQEAVAGYKSLIPTSKGNTKFMVQLELGEALLKQARLTIDQAEESGKVGLPDSVSTQLQEAQKLFLDLKNQTDKAGYELEAKDNSEAEKQRVNQANIRYQAWFGYCRSLFLQFKIGKDTGKKCLQELEGYIWDYEGKIASYYAILLRGLVFHEQKKFIDAVECFDSVIKALEENYLFNLEDSYLRYLDANTVTSKIQAIFQEKKKIELSNQGTIERLEKNSIWLISDRNDRFLIKKRGDSLDVYYILQSPTSMNLRLQALYYKTKTLVAAARYDQAISNVTEFDNKLQQLHKISLEDQLLGQATLLETGKAYIERSEHSKGLEIAEKIAEKATFWGNTAKRLLREWGQLAPSALQTSKNAYLVAMGLWNKNRYKDAVLSFQKVIQYATTKQDIEMYAIDSWDKMGQCFWMLKLYREAGICYQILAQDYKQYQKTVSTSSGKIEKISLADKAAYWAYRSFSESYKISNDSEEEKLAKIMLAYLTDNWPDSGYSLNRTYDQAREKEIEAEKTSSPQNAINKFIIAAQAYKNVKSGADQYEPSWVYAGKCYYKASEFQTKSEKNEEKKSTEISAKAREYLELAEQELSSYQKYVSDKPLPEADVQRISRRKEAMGLATFYLGRIALLKNNTEQAIHFFQKIRSEFSEQSDMVAISTYFIAKLKVEKKSLEEAEKLAIELEKRYGDEDPNSNISQYQSTLYALLGKEYDLKANEIQKEIDAQLAKGKNVDKEKLSALQNLWLEQGSKAGQYYYQWLIRKNTANAATFEQIASLLVKIAQKFQEKEQNNVALQYFQKAMPLFEKSLKLQKDSTRTEAIQFKIAQCATMSQSWEQALYSIYPVYHNDKTKREVKRKEERGPRGIKKPTTQKEDPQYLDMTAEILMGIGEQTNFKNSKELYKFLIQYAKRDFIDELKELIEFTPSAQGVYEKYLGLYKVTSWIRGEKLSEKDLQTITETWEKDKEKNKSVGNIQELLILYENKYNEILNREFDIKVVEQLNEEQIIKRTQNLAIYISYAFSSRLVESLPPYLNLQLRFGPYDNPQWWQAKYRQIYLNYLQEEKDLVRSSIEILRIQQKTLGGPKFASKFNELYSKVIK